MIPKGNGIVLPAVVVLAPFTGKSMLKYDTRSYHDMVVNQIQQMGEDNQQLGYYKDKLGEEKKHSKALEESFEIVSQKLRKTMEENRIVRQRTKMQQEENKEEVIYPLVFSKFIKSQDKEMEDYVEEREKLMKAHEEKFNDMRRRHWEEELELEKEFINAELTHLMNKYSPIHPKDTSNNGDV
ncbi:hypothetical protein TorRG33x02_322940 [Trema orientale]|uniref:Uncharacterized protein n=1 Tax=Trema orientale TaxID=63057 RepID=A0A2P5BFQ3_TREOI|nr:hypothetical protein TorRG33x02_322940 [Trema orientale]